MAAELLSSYGYQIEQLSLIPSSKGRFELMVGDELLYSKAALGRHANPGEIAALLEQRYGFKPAPKE